MLCQPSTARDRSPVSFAQLANTSPLYISLFLSTFTCSLAPRFNVARISQRPSCGWSRGINNRIHDTIGNVFSRYSSLMLATLSVPAFGLCNYHTGVLEFLHDAEASGLARIEISIVDEYWNDFGECHLLCLDRSWLAWNW